MSQTPFIMGPDKPVASVSQVFERDLDFQSFSLLLQNILPVMLRDALLCSFNRDFLLLAHGRPKPTLVVCVRAPRWGFRDSGRWLRTRAGRPFCHIRVCRSLWQGQGKAVPLPAFLVPSGLPPAVSPTAIGPALFSLPPALAPAAQSAPHALAPSVLVPVSLPLHGPSSLPGHLLPEP